MNETIRVEDLTFQVKRSERRKTIGLTVERDASLVAHLPKDADIGQANQLIRAKLVWVHQKLAAHKDTRRENVFRRPEFVDGEGFYFLGKLPDGSDAPAGHTNKLRAAAPVEALR